MLLFLPEAAAAQQSEPEDALVLGVGLGVMLYFTGVAWASRRVLKSAPQRPFVHRLLSGFNLLAAVICILIVGLAHSANQPSTTELYLFVLPALLFTANAYLLIRGPRTEKLAPRP